MNKKPYIPPTIDRHVIGLMNKHGHGVQTEPQEKIAGVAVSELIEEHGSPLFVIVEKELRQKYQDAYRAFSTRYPRVQFAWSYKTNYLKAVCRVFHQEGAIAEVVSDFEYEKARAMGVKGSEIVFNGPYKSEEILRTAVAEGARIQLDNLDEIVRLEQIARDAGTIVPVGMRVNMIAGSEPVWSKFGFNYESGEAHRIIRRLADEGQLKLVGLHMHLGTFVLDLRSYREGIGKLLELAQWARDELDIELEYINTGGGFGSINSLKHQYLPGHELTPSFDQYAEAICETLDEKMPDYAQPPLLLLETGRALVDEAGSLITTVVSVRHTADGGRALVVDAGVNLLYTANWYRLTMTPAQQTSGPNSKTVVYGPLCMNIDVIREDAPLPALNAGQQIVIHPVGAYNITQSMQFITYRPRVVMIGSDGQVDVIRDRETLESVEALELVPDRLADSGDEDS